MNFSVCASSLAGPALMLVAHPVTDCEPGSSSTVWSAPLVKLGASLTAVTVMVNVWVALLSTPKRSEERRVGKGSVMGAEPLALVEGVYLRTPRVLTGGPAEVRALVELVTMS